MASAAARRSNREPQPSTAQTFGAWLIEQAGKPGLVGKLAAGAAGDRAFPKTGTVEQVRARLVMTQADGDMFEALDDAESNWLAR